MKIVVLHSGGLDSSVLLHQLLNETHELKALSFDYGQKHSKELFYAQSLCEKLNIDHRIMNLSALRSLLGSSALTGQAEIPSGHYSDVSMKATVVPNRNMMMLSIALAWAIDLKWDAVAFAAHGGDHTIYPDCRPEFVKAIQTCAQHCDWHRADVLAPFLELKKFEIVKRGAPLGVRFENTWSCYRGGEIHCGTCGTCVERKEAFQLAGITDPTEYMRND